MLPLPIFRWLQDFLFFHFWISDPVFLGGGLLFKLQSNIRSIIPSAPLCWECLQSCLSPENCMTASCTKKQRSGNLRADLNPYSLAHTDQFIIAPNRSASSKYDLRDVGCV
ncbi:hypothetical protein EDB84DRAFT_1679665 [Lactarius hengduanensis]|nr:hypothetical protein EDB84DRAFT_1679665 [Lactarius hengduanensis]